jgi:hypothetical protein
MPVSFLTPDQTAQYGVLVAKGRKCTLRTCNGLGVFCVRPSKGPFQKST